MPAQGEANNIINADFRVSFLPKEIDIEIIEAVIRQYPYQLFCKQGEKGMRFYSRTKLINVAFH